MFDFARNPFAQALFFSLIAAAQWGCYMLLVRAIPAIWRRTAGYILVVAAGLLLVVLTGQMIGLRQQTGPAQHMDDSGIITEAAMRYLHDGRNPYVETYHNTPLGDYIYTKEGVNPALYHFVYLPGTLVVSYPVWRISQAWFGFYDQRFVSLIALGLLMFILLRLITKPNRVGLVAPLILLNPWFALFFVNGNNDVIMIALTVTALALFSWNHRYWGAIVLAVALSTKQIVWFALPFVAIYLWRKYLSRTSTKDDDWRQLLGVVALSFTVVAAIVMPFVWWDPAAIGEDTVAYFMGNVANPNTIGGLGLGELLVRSGLISSRTAAFPFWIFGLSLGLPALAYIAQRLMRVEHVTLSAVLVSWVVWFGVLGFAGRYFTVGHVGFIVTILAVAYLVRHKPESITHESPP